MSPPCDHDHDDVSHNVAHTITGMVHFLDHDHPDPSKNSYQLFKKKVGWPRDLPGQLGLLDQDQLPWQLASIRSGESCARRPGACRLQLLVTMTFMIAPRALSLRCGVGHNAITDLADQLLIST